jgi:hypothetical protein
MIKRDRAPFVLTSEFAHVLGGKDSDNFRNFQTLCSVAFNNLRKHAHVFISLFAMVRLLCLLQ